MVTGKGGCEGGCDGGCEGMWIVGSLGSESASTLTISTFTNGEAIKEGEIGGEGGRGAGEGDLAGDVRLEGSGPTDRRRGSRRLTRTADTWTHNVIKNVTVCRCHGRVKNTNNNEDRQRRFPVGGLQNDLDLVVRDIERFMDWRRGSRPGNAMPHTHM